MKPIWNSHFEMIQEIAKVKFERAVVPEDAVNLKINTIDHVQNSFQTDSRNLEQNICCEDEHTYW